MRTLSGWFSVLRVIPAGFWLQAFEVIGVRRLCRFVIASLLLEVWAAEGPEIDGHRGPAWG
jgi:hypothetical protein